MHDISNEIWKGTTLFIAASYCVMYSCKLKLDELNEVWIYGTEDEILIMISS